jgi:LPS export ABC transporter protein LptC
MFTPGPEHAPASGSRARAPSGPQRVRRLGLVLGLLVAPAATAAPPMQITGMTFVSTSGAVADLVVRARHAVVDVESNQAQLEEVAAEFSGDDGEMSLELQCDRGEFDLVTNDFLAEGEVRGRLADGRRFEGPWLRYDRARAIAYTDAPVTILEGDRTLRGGGFRYHVRQGRLRLTGGASIVERH